MSTETTRKTSSRYRTATNHCAHCDALLDPDARIYSIRSPFLVFCKPECKRLYRERHPRTEQ